MSSGEKSLQQPAHLIRLLPEGRFAPRRRGNSDLNHACRICRSPTYNIGSSCFCTRVLNSIVGAAIGRPPVNIRSDVKKNASAVKISRISIIGLAQKRNAPFFIRIAFRQPPADERCSPLQNCGLLQSLIQTAEIYRLPPLSK